MNLRFLSLYILSKYNIIVDLIIFQYFVIETVVPYRGISYYLEMVIIKCVHECSRVRLCV